MRMNRAELQHAVEGLQSTLSPRQVEQGINRLLARDGEELGGGVNAMRLVQHLLGEPLLPDADLVWAYDRVKTRLEACIAEIPTLYFFSGD